MDNTFDRFNDPDRDSLLSAVRFLVLAGLLNAVIAAFLLCRLPESHAPRLGALLARAVIYVGIGALGGVAGAWFYWKRSSTAFHLRALSPFRLFALTGAAAWIWVPSLVLLSRRDSPAGAAIAVVGSVILAIGVRKTIPLGEPLGSLAIDPTQERELFAATLATPARSARGYIIAIAIYAAGYALQDGSTLTASGLFALGAFLFAWEATLAPGSRFGYWDSRSAGLRLIRFTVPAILITLWALMDGISHREQVAAAGAAFADGGDAEKRRVKEVAPGGRDGYESIVLWPLPEKKQIIPPLPARTNLLAPGTFKPLIIRFDGPYFYFQAGRRPDSASHQAQGTPLGVHIEAANSIPLSIEARQTLSTAIPIARCGEMEVDIQNRDNQPGTIAMAVLLRDSTKPRKPALYLGQQPIESTQPMHFTFKSAPVFETLRFAVPAHASFRAFDEITVMLLPDENHALVGPKIAIREFQLFPR